MPSELDVSLVANDYCNDETNRDSFESSTQSTQLKSEETTISIDEAIDGIGIGAMQYRILFSAGMCYMADSMEVMLLAFLTVLLQDEWDLSATQTATITGCVFIGEFTGSLFLGQLGDRVGRYPVFMTSGITIFLFGVGTSFVSGYNTLLLTRFVVGFGIGGSTVPYDILAEFSPTNTRGELLPLNSYFWTAGAVIVPALAYLTIKIWNSWRIFVALCSIPCFVSVVLGLIFVPESPRWLLSKGRNSEALKILRTAALTNGKDPDLLFPPGSRLKDDVEHGEANFLDLLHPKWRRLTLMLWVVWGGYAMGYYSTVLVTPRILMNEASTDATDFDYVAIIISSSAEFLGTTLARFLVDRIGRIPCQVGAYSFAGLSLFLLCILSGKLDQNILVIFSFSARMLELMGNTCVWISTAELYSTGIRSTGHSGANAVARLGAFLSPYLVSGHVSIPVVGIVLSIVYLIVALFASKLPETKGMVLSTSPQDHEGDVTEQRQASGFV